MIELVIVKRTRRTSAHTESTLKLEMYGNRFNISHFACISMGVKKDDGLMFGFNMKEKRCFVFKDDEPDAFILRQKTSKDALLGFCSKDLASYFVDCFDLKYEEKSYYFTIGKTKNKKGYYKINLK